MGISIERATKLYEALVNTGGFTTPLIGSRDIKYGYVCAVKTVAKGQFNLTTPEVIKHLFVYAEEESLGRDIDTCFGAWHDTRTGQVLFEVAQRCNTLQAALGMALTHSQETVYDVVNKKVLWANIEPKYNHVAALTPSYSCAGDMRATLESAFRKLPLKARRTKSVPPGHLCYYRLFATEAPL